MFRIVKHRKPGICVAHGCKSKTKRDRFCPKHSKRYQKLKNPVKYKYHQLKYRAIERGKEFTLTIEEFRVFCDETGYMETKGKASWKSTIDRIDPDKGYSIDNIQIMTNGDNVRKMHSDKTEQSDDDVPF